MNINYDYNNAANRTKSVFTNPTQGDELSKIFDPGDFFGNGANQNFDPYGGMPAAPGYQPIYSNSWDLGMNGPAQKMLEAQGTRTGPSPWANLSTMQQNKEELNARDRAVANAAGATGAARSALASQGGLTSGARERVQEAGAKAGVAGQQEASRQGSLNRMQVGINDESNRLQNLGTAAGMEQQNAATNMAARVANLNAINAYNQNLYNTQGQIWAGGKAADATANQKSGGSSFICSELRKQGLLTKKETAVLFKFMLRAFFKRAEFMVWYFRHAPSAIERLNKDGFHWPSIKKEFCDDILLELIQHGDEAAQSLYIKSTKELLKKAGVHTSKHFKSNRLKTVLYGPILFTKRKVLEWYMGEARSFISRRLA